MVNSGKLWTWWWNYENFCTSWITINSSKKTLRYAAIKEFTFLVAAITHSNWIHPPPVRNWHKMVWTVFTESLSTSSTVMFTFSCCKPLVATMTTLNQKHKVQIQHECNNLINAVKEKWTDRVTPAVARNTSKPWKCIYYSRGWHPFLIVDHNGYSYLCWGPQKKLRILWTAGKTIFL